MYVLLALMFSSCSVEGGGFDLYQQGQCLGRLGEGALRVDFGG